MIICAMPSESRIRGGLVVGKRVPMDVEVGNKVLYSKYAGTDVKVEGEEYIILKQDDILAIVE